ncbi:hypothetical protein GCM10023189_30910 [Nibrella saemangeumensis]|uniref:DUF4350 domain-containing protein n=1 Tax=Nibrella saemangeumensis TaxID=1084526 RepID=A0ABP8N3B5_9BACT
MKPNKYLLILLVTVISYSLFEYYRPKPIDWKESYMNKDRIPFGARALYELLPGLMQQPSVPSLRVPIYNHLTEGKLPKQSNYVFICGRFLPTKSEIQLLLRYVSRGNNVFISAYVITDSLGKTLGFKTAEKAPKLIDTTLVNNFTNAHLRKPGGYRFRDDDGRNYLTLIKPERITVLGRNARREPVFIRISHGQGSFYIHNLPLAFTNYYVLDPATSDYAFKALSYLPPCPTYWDEFIKQGRFDESQQSLFRYVFTQPALIWAYYLVLFGLVLYAIFAGKRTQRIIPVVEPPRNTSLEFVQTIGRLYFQQNDHDNLARKKIQYFLAYVREQFGLNTTVLDKNFAETLAQKSGVPAEDVTVLVRRIDAARRSTLLSEYELLNVNQDIEAFYQHVNA